MTQRIPTLTSDYAPFLTLYFEEEIMGEAYFLGLTRYYSEPHQCEKLSLLSRIERCVADSVHPLLLRHGLNPRSDKTLHDLGLEHVERHRSTTWLEYMESITDRFPAYIEEFAALSRIAPDEDRKLLKPFTEHEVVGIEFAEREIAGAQDSAAVLTRYIQSF